MPYIKSIDRILLDKEIDNLFDILENRNHNKGNYNYIITRLLHIFIASKGLNYDNLNDAIGIIECVKMELERTIIAPYEDLKRNSNGDIGVIFGQRKIDWDRGEEVYEEHERKNK